MSRSDTAAWDEARPAVPSAHPQADWRLWLALAVSLLALGAVQLIVQPSPSTGSRRPL